MGADHAGWSARGNRLCEVLVALIAGVGAGCGIEKFCHGERW